MASQNCHGGQTPASERSWITTKSVLMDCVESAVFDSQVGWICAVLRNGQLRELTFGHPSPVAAFRALKHSDTAPSEPRKALRQLIRRLQSFLQCPKDDFLDVKIDLDEYTAFQRAIVQSCRAIAIGKTLSYGELAKAAGYPKAARAVGQVMACNRFPLIVPCHRVIASGGSIGGFSARHGVRMKRRLLDLEQTGGPEQSQRISGTLTSRTIGY